MENHSLIDKIKNKNGELELKKIYQKYRSEFLLWAVRDHSCTMEEAQDIFQQTVVIFYENIIQEKVSEITSKVKTYLFGIGKNKIYELSRDKRKKQFQVHEQIFVNSDNYFENEDKEYEEKLNKVKVCLIKLGDPCKTLLEQYYYHNKSMIEISGILDYKNSDTTKNLKYKCLQRLRRMFISDLDTLNKQTQ